jgi:Protein of unknown function (DUF1345)
LKMARSQQQAGVLQFRCAIESRWPVILAIFSVVLLLTVLPSRVRVFPAWVPWLTLIVVIVPMAALALNTATGRLLRIERIVTVLFFVVAACGIIATLKILLSAMVRHSSAVTGLQLLTSSIAVWATNVLVFSVAYWRIDRGGPEARANHVNGKPDWLFPQENAGEDVPPDWRPTFVDYLFLAFCTATAFSPTDVQPLTSRSKLLMMLESTISLVTTVAVAARAINILGT